MTEPIKSKRPRGRPKGTNKEGARRELLPSEQDALFRAAHRRGIYEEFLLKMVYTLALRVKELIELRLDAFNSATHEVLVHGAKGGEARHYQIPDLWPLYLSWLKERQAQASNPWLFPHRDKPDDHLTPGGAKCVFYNTARDAGITGHSIHDLRHSLGQDMANAGDPQVFIAAWLRHQSVSSAAHYVSTRLKAEHQAVMLERRRRQWRKRP